MLLVDSSVWINQFRRQASEGGYFIARRDEAEEVCVTGVVLQEVLQGARSEAEFERIRAVMTAYPLLEPQEHSTYELAAQLYRRARASGFTIRSSNDCLIAAVALEHDALLVHDDRDFFALAQVEASLLLYPGRAH